MKCSIVVGLLNSWLIFSCRFIVNASPHNKCIIDNNDFFTNVTALNNHQPAQICFSIEKFENTFRMSGQCMLGVFYFVCNWNVKNYLEEKN